MLPFQDNSAPNWGDAFSKGQDVSKIFAEGEAADPYKAAKIASDPELVQIAPEIALATGDGETAFKILDEFGRRPSPLRPADTQLVTQFYDRIGPTANPLTRQGLNSIFTRIVPEDQERLAAQALLYLQNDPIDFNDPLAQQRFHAFLADKANRMQRLSSTGARGGLLEMLDVPYNWVTSQVGKAFGWADPTRAPLREAMSPGQNIAVSMFGLSPGSQEYDLTSGGIDFVSRFTLEPIDWVARPLTGALKAT